MYREQGATSEAQQASSLQRGRPVPTLARAEYSVQAPGPAAGQRLPGVVEAPASAARGAKKGSSAAELAASAPSAGSLPHAVGGTPTNQAPGQSATLQTPTYFCFAAASNAQQKSAHNAPDTIDSRQHGNVLRRACRC